MPQIEITVEDKVLVGRIGNPPHGLMNEETADELAHLLDRVESDDAIRAVILTGSTPGLFIRHYDVAVLEQRGSALAEKGYTFDPTRPVPETPFLSALRRMEQIPKPFIAALNGTAMGGGFELALACDIRLALEGPYQLGLPEINIGLLPGAGGTQRLTRIIGEARALELILTGTTFSPAQAVALGVVSQCFEADVMAPALSLARKLATKHPKALGHIKHLVRSANQMPLDEGLAIERTLFCDLMVDPESLKLMQRMTREELDIVSIGRTET